MNEGRLKNLVDFTARYAKEQAARLKDLKYAMATRDLNRRFVRVGAIQVPFPSIAALDVIENYIGGLDEIDLERYEDVGVFVYVCENQGNMGELADLDRAEFRRRVLVWMSTIDAMSDAWLEYTTAVDAILRTIKKNWMQRQVELMQATLAMISDSAAHSHA